MNKYRPNMIPRVDPREDGSKQATNITKFLTACSSQGMPSDDLFYRDDLINATPESLYRVARTIVALPKLFEPPTVDESKILTGQKRAEASGAAPDIGLFSLTSQSRLSPSESHAVLGRKQWPPAEPTFPLLRSDSPSGTSNGTARNITSKSGRSLQTTTKTVQDCGDEVGSDNLHSLPPKSLLRGQYHSKDAGESSPNHLSTIKPVEFPRHESISQSSSPVTGDYGGDVPIRQSRTSSNLTENTAYSSIFDLRRNVSAQTKFGTVRTATTEATSLGSEIPSFTRTEGSSLAASLVEEMGWRRSTSTDTTRLSERRPSEPVVPDLVSLAEEEETSACGSSSRDTHQERPKDPQGDREVVRLGKGKWPDDFIAAFQAAGPSVPIPTAALKDHGDPWMIPSPLSGRKLSIVTPTKHSTDGFDPLPRRPNSRHGSDISALTPRESVSRIDIDPFSRRPSSRHGTDTSILIPRESVLRADIRSDSPSTPGSRVILRRQNTRNAPIRRSGTYVPRNPLDGGERERSSPIPFPRAVSGDHSVSGSPTPDTSRGRDRSTSQDVSRIRGRFQSDIDDPRLRRRSRRNSYDELGRSRRSR